MKKTLCALLLISLSFMAFGCNNSQAEENEWLKNRVSVLEEENTMLKETIDRYDDAVTELQDRLENNKTIVVREIKNKDFLYLTDSYDYLLHRLNYINEELCSIQYDLEYAKKQSDIDDIYSDIEKLREEIGSDYNEFEDILSEYI